MASDSSSIGVVEEWLRSVCLVQYTQAFLDNGYDDLEVCKQIGEEDLDAIGVPKNYHREKLLKAVNLLRDVGTTGYFTLEESDTCDEVGDNTTEESSCTSTGVGAAIRFRGGARTDSDVYDMGKNTLVTYPKIQLKCIVRDKLVEENIDLAGPPYTNSDLVMCSSSLTALAMRFADELKTHYMDVLERLEELWLVARSNELHLDMCASQSRAVYSTDKTFYHGHLHNYLSHNPNYTESPQSQPPPLPSCPPPAMMSGAYTDRCSNLKSHHDSFSMRPIPQTCQNCTSLDRETAGISEDKKKSGSVFGRFLRNIGFRKSHRKGSYKQHQGDLSAYEMSMSDEDRMALMILVKEGKISTQTALAVVQRFEEEQKVAGKAGILDSVYKGQGKKKKTLQPMKSQASTSADVPCRRPQVDSPSGKGQPYDHQMCRQRRVHSLGQLEVPHIRPQFEHQHSQQHERVVLTRAVSCSPACTHSHRLTTKMEPSTLVKLYSSNHHPLLQQQPPHHHSNYKIDTFRGKLIGRPGNTVPKTSSRTSLLSSESEQSVECGMQAPLRAYPVPRQGGDDSAISVNSDPGRKKGGNILGLKLKSCQSGCAGDDEKSSENDGFQKRSSRIRNTFGTRPPLLRQHSATEDLPPYTGPCLGQAKVIMDYVPDPEKEEDYVSLKEGDIINIIGMTQSGVGMGIIGEKRGKFRLEHVEMVTVQGRVTGEKMLDADKDAPQSVSGLLHKCGLGHLTTLFVLNGYDDLEIFSELNDHDLDKLQISNVDERTKLVSAIRAQRCCQENININTLNLTGVGPPLTKVDKSSYASGFYVGGDDKNQRLHKSRESGGAQMSENKFQVLGNCHQTVGTAHSCHSCGKPKQLRKCSGPLPSSEYFSGQYITKTPSDITESQYAPSHIIESQYTPCHITESQYTPSHRVQSQCTSCNITQPQYTASHMLHYTGLSQHFSGHINSSSYPYRPPHSTGHLDYQHLSGHDHYGPVHSQCTISISKALSEMSVADGHNVIGRLKTFTERRNRNNTTNLVYADTDRRNRDNTTNLVYADTDRRNRDNTTNLVYADTDRRNRDNTTNLVYADTDRKNRDNTTNLVYDDTDRKNRDNTTNLVYADTDRRNRDNTTNLVYADTDRRNRDNTTNLVYADTDRRNRDNTTNLVYADTDRRNKDNTTNLVYADKQSTGNDNYESLRDASSAGDRISFSEEDQEVIAITYGTKEAGTENTLRQPLSREVSQLEMTNTLACSACIASGCAQCEESMFCDSLSCPQCLAYMSCSQCFPYKHYVNMRSDSKSSKMSCSSTCTQTTCLSPDHDDTSQNGGPNLIDYTSSSQLGNSMFRPTVFRSQLCNYYQQHYLQNPTYLQHPTCLQHPAYVHMPLTPQLPSPAPIASHLASISPVTHTLADINAAQGLALTFQRDASLSPHVDWGSHSEDGDTPGIATLYSRGRSQTPDKSEKGHSSQMKSPTRSLMPLVSTKLSAEMIDLTQPPYSTTMGHCGIPPLLVQRYSEELRQDLATMSVVLEQLREKQLRSFGRPCIQNESLSESCKNACDLQISSMTSFLVSVGLPMYQRSLNEAGISGLEQLLKLTESELEQITGADSRHLRRIAHALEWVRRKLSSPSHSSRICTADKM